MKGSASADIDQIVGMITRIDKTIRDNILGNRKVG